MDTEQVKNSETGYVLVVFRGVEPVATSISMDAGVSVDEVCEATTRAIVEAVCGEKPTDGGDAHGNR